MMSGGLLFKPVIGHLSDRINRLFIMMLLTFLAGVSLYFLTIETSIIGLIIVSFYYLKLERFIQFGPLLLWIIGTKKPLVQN